MFREMSEIELTIRSIEQVRMISIYELTGTGVRPGHGCAAIAVLYGKNGQINLCELDEGFNLLVDRVFEIYEELPDKQQVAMDEKTRKILESGLQEKDESFLEVFYSLTPVPFPKVGFESALARRFLPMVEYLLDAFYKMLGIKYEVTISKPGWRGAGVVYGLLNGQRLVSGVRIVQNSAEEYEINVNNFPGAGNTLRLIVSVFRDSLLVEFSSSFQQFVGTGIYELKGNGYVESFEAFKEGKKVFVDSREIRCGEGLLDGEECRDILCLIPWPFEGCVAVKLPWGLYCLTARERNETAEFLVDDYRSCFVYRDAGFSESCCWTRITNKETGFSLKTSSVMMQQMKLVHGGFQTRFLSHPGNHKNRYRQMLEGRYFMTE